MHTCRDQRTTLQVSSLLSPYEISRWHLGHQACTQVPLSTEPTSRLYESPDLWDLGIATENRLRQSFCSPSWLGTRAQPLFYLISRVCFWEKGIKQVLSIVIGRTMAVTMSTFLPPEPYKYIVVCDRWDNRSLNIHFPTIRTFRIYCFL